MVRPRVHRLDQDPEQPEQDGHLDDQRAQAAHRVDTRLPVELHRLRGHPLTVPAEALLNLAHLWLQVRHGLHLLQLLDGQWEGDQADKDRENNDSYAHVVEADGVQHHQQVQHGPDDYFPPEIVDTQGDLPRH